jgi:hypothetical protein
MNIKDKGKEAVNWMVPDLLPLPVTAAAVNSNE